MASGVSLGKLKTSLSGFFRRHSRQSFDDSRTISNPALNTVGLDCLFDSVNSEDAVPSHLTTWNITNTRPRIVTTEQFEHALLHHGSPKCVGVLILEQQHSLRAIPSVIGVFNCLVKLCLKDNAIEVIPWTIVFLRQLRSIDLSFNLLTSLPRTIGSLTELRHINLAANHLSSLPTELLQLQNLVSLDVRLNANLISPPLEVCKRGWSETAAALRTRLGRANLWDVTSNDVRTLFDLSIECILGSGIEYSRFFGVPPVLKNYLHDLATEQQKRICLAKCSVCKAYFSTQIGYESHACKTVAHPILQQLQGTVSNIVQNLR